MPAPKELPIRTARRCELINITGEVQSFLKEAQAHSGTLVLFVPHTTAGVTINENADPDVTRDMISFTSGLIPEDSGFAHSEGNSDAHIKSSLFSPSLTVIVADGRLCLGTWQGIYFAEFDGPRSRKLWLKFQPDPEK
ncbi:MAG: secondary thiamine-phosphate synthase enzyme YjbQ [Elusimicrobia bacterium]|nr:secondary thiamine-phosphate synthase enzyme YjbQ [Elusimicrobiota bacterium]